jgi:NADH-quinone oxidoreductase subunit H
LATIAIGVYVTAIMDSAVGQAVAGTRSRFREVLAGPARSAAALMLTSRAGTERPDAAAWALAPALYLGLAAVALAVIPLSPSAVVADVGVGMVVFGAAQALVVIPVFLHGWSSNSAFPLIGGFRFIAQALSFEMPNLLALLAVTVPAQSLSVREVVMNQQGLWNIVRMPPGLPLFLVAALGLSFWGPLNLPDGPDLAGGSTAETSGSQLLVWRMARAAMLVATAAMGAAAFLGGWLGPWLPAPVWMVLKTFALLALLIGVGHLSARVRPERFVVISWAVLIPIALANVLLAAGVALIQGRGAP